MKLDKLENTEDLNGFKKSFFGITISDIMRRFPENIDLNNESI